jgi:hypothetical protein
VKRISILGFGALLVLAGTPALGQDFTAGKTPAQLFGSDCSECHRTPNGLAKGRDVKTLAGFLREHYTTKSDTAGSLAAYVSGFTGSGPADARNRAGAGPSPPAPAERADRRKRDADPAALGDDAGPGAKSAEDQRARRRQPTVNLSGDGEKRRVRDDGDMARPPAGAAAPPPAAAAPARTAARTGESAPREAADPLSRLRPYLTSGLGYEGTVAEAAKAGKSRKRQSKEAGQAPPDAPPAAKADASPAAPTVPSGATAAAAAPAESAATMPAIAPPGTPAPAPAAAPAPATAPAAVVAPPRLGQ